MNRTDYEKLTDSQLSLLARGGDMAANEFLLEKYKYLVRQVTAPYFLVGGDRDDLLQEGMIGLNNAIHSFREDRNVSFTVFAEFCIKRNIISAVRAATRQKHQPLNSYVSIFADEGQNQDEQSALLADALPESPNPENLFIEEENSRLLDENLKECLSKMEFKVLKLFMEGQSYHDIANALGKDIKSVDNALQRIKKKIREAGLYEQIR